MVQERANAHRHLFGTPDAPSLASASLSGEEITEELLVAATPSEMLEHTVSNLDALLGQYEEADQLHKAIKENKRCACVCALCMCIACACACARPRVFRAYLHPHGRVFAPTRARVHNRHMNYVQILA